VPRIAYCLAGKTWLAAWQPTKELPVLFISWCQHFAMVENLHTIAAGWHLHVGKLA